MRRPSPICAPRWRPISRSGTATGSGRRSRARGPSSATSTVARVLVARSGASVVGTVRLATRKPWAIDPAWFTPCARVLYLTDMAVDPGQQRQGIGRRCLAHARDVARAWPADALRLDAYDAPAGAGGFYEKCGFREVGRVTYRQTPLVYYELLL